MFNVLYAPPAQTGPLEKCALLYSGPGGYCCTPGSHIPLLLNCEQAATTNSKCNP